MKLQLALLLFFGLLAESLLAQVSMTPRVVAKSGTTSVSAQVSDIFNLTTMRDVNLNSPVAVDGVITVNPTNSPFAGMMRINGQPGKQIRITYLAFETLIDENGSGGVVRANYRISGFETDNQNASVLLDLGEANVRLGPDGTYHIWLGAVLDIREAKPGAYVSEFIMEIEGN
jgi:hypothetical protein